MSSLNHQAYIERQAHYGGWVLSLSTLPIQGLADEVPLPGLADPMVRKTEVPSRVQRKRAETLAKTKTLRQMCEEASAMSQNR